MTPPGVDVALKRRFLQVGDRRVHYLRAGSGPPAVLIHSSPANAWFLKSEIAYLAAHYTVFAFDTPGFGLSQPLPLKTMIVADLADAMARTLEAIAMPPCPVFGSHSGAAIALELGVRRPQRVTGLVLDGVPAFTDAECAALFGDYFRPLPISDLGGHYSEVWTRLRDQSIWFPWSLRRPENLNGYDLSTPESTHLWASMYFDAADTYTPAYYATTHYRGRAIEAVAELELPAIYTATTTDMLYPHMARFGPLKPGQEIREIGTSTAAKYALIQEGFERFGGAEDAPADRDALVSGPNLSRQFIDAPSGGQLHFRYAGAADAPPVLLLHDAPGSSALLEPLILDLAKRHFVIAPDLPGNGESDAFADGDPTVERFAASAADLLTAAGLTSVQVYGLGFGASVAAQLAADRSDLVAGIVVGGLLAASEDERDILAKAYTPPIAIEADGSHWYRTWLMLRDSLVWWPWCDRRKVAQRKTVEDFDARRLHNWTVEVMRRRSSYGHLVQAAVAHDAIATARRVRVPARRLTAAPTPLAIYDEPVAQALAHWPATVFDDRASGADGLFKAFDDNLKDAHRAGAPLT